MASDAAQAMGQDAGPVNTPGSTLDVSDMQGNAGKACGLLKAMANEARLMVLCHLVQGEKSVTELQEAIGLSQSAMSQHLAVLREQEIVSTRREGQSVFYRIANRQAMAVIATLHREFCEAPANRGHR